LNVPFSLFVFYAATNKSDFKQIAEASPNSPWILHPAPDVAKAANVATPLCVFSMNRYGVYSADYDPR
jgi:hypothetical protein